MKVLVFDTETTGLPKWRGQDAYKGGWPDIVSICWVILDYNKEIKRRYYVIKPDRWTIPIESTKIHGITQEYAMGNGVELKTVLKEFKEDMEQSRWIVAHNLEFDTNVMIAAYYWRLRDDPKRFWNKSKEFCSMLQGSKELNILDEQGRQKWPKLDDLYEISCGKKAPADAHNAQRDVNVLIEILKNRNWLDALLLIA